MIRVGREPALGPVYATFPAHTASDRAIGATPGLAFRLVGDDMTRMERIKSYESAFWDKVEISGGCWNWKASTTPNGYGQMWTGDKTRTGKKRMTYAHRMAWMLVRGPIPGGLEVMHTCDNPRCVRPSHLRTGTHQENMKDAGTKGILPRGMRHHWRKITEAKAKAIKRALASGLSKSEAAKACGVSYWYAYDIAKGNSWAHL